MRKFILSGVALLGLAFSLILTQHFYEIRGESSHFKSSCNIGQSFNCDIVAASPSAELIAGLPISSFAAGWFLTLFVMSLFLFQKYWRREAVRTYFGMSVVGTAIGAIYFLIMKFQLQTLCLYCLGVDLCSVVGLLISLSLKPEGFAQHPMDRPKLRTFAIIGVIAILATVGGLDLLQKSAFQGADVKEVVDSILNSPVVAVQSGAELPSVGAKTAPITIVEFSDYQCPYCRIGALSVNPLLYRYPGKVRIVFRNFPLDQKCNPDGPQLHHSACEAAKVALCALDQGKFEHAYETLFEKQSAFSPGNIAQLVSGEGIDINQLKSCMDSAQTGMRITRDITEGKELKITGTPTFFVNGHRVDGVRPTEVWNQVVDRLLK